MILRLTIAIFLVHDASVRLAENVTLTHLIPPILSAAAGVLLLVGLWTPIAGALSTFLQLWMAFSHFDNFWTAMLATAMTAGLALLGPGAWSLDALAYGRKRISILGP